MLLLKRRIVMAVLMVLDIITTVLTPGKVDLRPVPMEKNRFFGRR